MKMDALVPSEGVYFWDDADLILEFADKINADVHGHVLVWHSQQPDWLDDYEGTSEDWENLLENHIQTVVGRYKGTIDSWDVVNEAFNDDGSGFRNTNWYENIGEDYLENAFRWAHEADPDAILYYNDYSLSENTSKLDFVIDKIEQLIDDGVPIHGIGFQMHITDEWPTLDAMRGAIEKVEQLGIRLRITELDVSMNQDKVYTDLSDELSIKQKNRYKNVTSLFLQSQKLHVITLWGVSDADSWIPIFFKRADWPLLFDENYDPKPAAQGFLEALS
jgi:endo-1,4-beta-xylanase